MTASSPPVRRAAYQTIDAIRLFAALAVVWNHAWNMAAGPADTAPAPLGRVAHVIYSTAGFGQDAVSVFFVVSGYWITGSVLSRIEGRRWSWRDYLFDRISRLWIVLVPALAIGGLIDGAGLRLVGDGYPAFVAQRLDAAHFLVSLLFLQELVLPPFGSNGPLWSLAYEFWYYLWFPPIALMLARRRLAWGSIAVLAATMAIGFVYLRLFPVWLLGSAAFVIARRWPAGGLDGRTRAALLAGGLVAFGAAEVAAHLFKSTLVQNAYVVGFGFALLLLALLRADAGISARLKPLADYGARSSFSLYVAHAPLLALLIAVTGQHPADHRVALGVALAVTVAALAYGYVFSLATERRTDAIRRSLARHVGAMPLRRVKGAEHRYDGEERRATPRPEEPTVPRPVEAQRRRA